MRFGRRLHHAVIVVASIFCRLGPCTKLTTQLRRIRSQAARAFFFDAKARLTPSLFNRLIKIVRGPAALVRTEPGRDKPALYLTLGGTLIVNSLLSISYSTTCPSLSELRPARSTALMCTNTIFTATTLWLNEPVTFGPEPLHSAGPLPGLLINSSSNTVVRLSPVPYAPRPSPLQLCRAMSR